MKDFLNKNWLLICAGLLVLLVITIFLMMITSNPQKGGFVYQIF